MTHNYLLGQIPPGYTPDPFPNTGADMDPANVPSIPQEV